MRLLLLLVNLNIYIKVCISFELKFPSHGKDRRSGCQRESSKNLEALCGATPRNEQPISPITE